jgi:hypothetical protein
MIDAEQARQALADIDDITRRVRQSVLYDLSSLIMIWWGVIVFAGNVTNYLWPRYGAYIWPGVNVAGVAGTVAISALLHLRTRSPNLNGRVIVAYLLFYAFGYLCSRVFGNFGPRQMGAFWPTYIMLFYVLAGLWCGRAFIAIGLAVTTLTLIGYFFVTSAAFLLWMAVVNGGGLVLGGLWMRQD